MSCEVVLSKRVAGRGLRLCDWLRRQRQGCERERRIGRILPRDAGKNLIRFRKSVYSEAKNFIKSAFSDNQHSFPLKIEAQ